MLTPTWTARRSKQSILKEISPEYSLEGLMLKLKLQYFGHLMWLIGKDPDDGKDWKQEEKGTTEDEMVGWNHQLDGHEFEQALGVGDGQEAWRAAVHGVTKSRTQLSHWTELNWTELLLSQIVMWHKWDIINKISLSVANPSLSPSPASLLPSCTSFLVSLCYTGWSV